MPEPTDCPPQEQETGLRQKPRKVTDPACASCGAHPGFLLRVLVKGELVSLCDRCRGSRPCVTAVHVAFSGRKIL